MDVNDLERVFSGEREGGREERRKEGREGGGNSVGELHLNHINATSCLERW